MAGIDDVLERLVNDPEFRAQLATDPATALAGYALSPADVALLAASLPEGAGDVPHGVEQRTSKSALVGLLASLAPAGSATPADGAGRGRDVTLGRGGGQGAIGGTSDGDLVLTTIDKAGASSTIPAPPPPVMPSAVAVADFNGDGAAAELATPGAGDTLPQEPPDASPVRVAPRQQPAPPDDFLTVDDA